MRALSRVLNVMVVVTVGVAASGCAPLPRQAFADARKADYYASQAALSPELTRAIERGRLIADMSPEQVRVVLGDPDRKTRFEATATEVWVYRAGRAHVNQLPDGIQAFRVVFLKDRLVFIAPL